MSFTTKREATKFGNQLIKKLKSEGWNLRVDENMGWYYSVWKGPISISGYHNGKEITYSVLINSDGDRPPVSGLGMWMSSDVNKTYRKDPNKAVRFAVEYARSVVNALLLELQAAEAAISGSDDEG